MTHAITFSGGKARAIYADDLAPVFEALDPGFRQGFARNVRRASDVEPADGGWVATIREGVGRCACVAGVAALGFHDARCPALGVKLGPFLAREDALAAEVDWLRAHAL